jgi:DNA polymerase-3 subunit delta'
MPHGWLLSGPRGVGKATLAYRMARRLLAEPREAERCNEPASAIFRMVAADAHPDLKVIDEPIDPKDGKLKSNVPVGLVRIRMDEIYKTAAMGGRRVLLLDPDVDLGDSSANALLKLLEEPPPGVVLIVVAQPFLHLPATIASRCARLRLRPLPASTVMQGLLQLVSGIPPEAAARLAELAGGSIGRALFLNEIDWPTQYGRVLADLAGGGRSLEVADQLLKLAGKGGGILVAAELLGHVVRRAARHAAGRPPGPSLVADEPRLLEALPGAASLDRCVGLWDKLAASAVQAEALNLDPMQTLIGLIHDLATPPGGGSPASTV